jgi:DNA anti-recombination protein RmuC
MHADLELIASADEEARARVGEEEARHGRDVAAARSACDAKLAARRAETAATLDAELRAIREEANRRVLELQRQQTEYLDALARAGERKFDDAVALYLKIVCEVSA